MPERVRKSTGRQQSAPRRVQFICDLYFAEVHAGVVDYTRTAEWSLFDGKCYRPFLDYDEDWDGILAIVTQPTLAEMLKKQSCPIVRILCSDLPNLQYPAVEPDVEAIGARAAEHFMSLGAPSCAFYAGSLTDETARMWRGFSQGFASGYQKPMLIDFSEGQTPEQVAAISRPERWAWLARKLEGIPRPVAVLAEDDRFTYDIVRAADLLGWRIPEDLALLGTDNRELILGKMSIPISSVDSNLRGIGWAAAALLDQIMDGKEPPTDPIRIQPGQVIVRRSTATYVCDHPRVSAAVTFLRSHFNQPLHIKDIARAAGISERSLQSAFKEHVGCTVWDELSRVRLAHAARLLRDTDLKLESIAYESGFRDAKYLCEVFRPAFGSTPTTYREAHRKRRSDGK